MLELTEYVRDYYMLYFNSPITIFMFGSCVGGTYWDNFFRQSNQKIVFKMHGYPWILICI